MCAFKATFVADERRDRDPGHPTLYWEGTIMTYKGSWAFLCVPSSSLQIYKIIDLAALASPEKAGVGGSTPSRGTSLISNLPIQILQNNGGGAADWPLQNLLELESVRAAASTNGTTADTTRPERYGLRDGEGWGTILTSSGTRRVYPWKKACGPGKVVSHESSS